MSVESGNDGESGVLWVYYIILKTFTTTTTTKREGGKFIKKRNRPSHLSDSLFYESREYSREEENEDLHEIDDEKSSARERKKTHS